MSETLERYRFFKNMVDLMDQVKRLVDQQLVLLSVLQQRGAVQVAAAPTASPAPQAAPLTQGSVVVIAAPVELVDSQMVTVEPDTTYRFELTPSDLLMLTSLDDTVYYSPREFTSLDKGVIPLLPGTTIVLRVPSTWRELWFRSESTETRLYVTQWRYVRA